MFTRANKVIVTERKEKNIVHSLSKGDSDQQKGVLNELCVIIREIRGR